MSNDDKGGYLPIKTAARKDATQCTCHGAARRECDCLAMAPVKAGAAPRINHRFSVYLAGPITGLTFDGAADWRLKATDALAGFGIKGFSPLRAKDYLRSVGELTALCEGYGDLNCLSAPRGIMTRDRYDATHCNALLVNFLGATRVSIGTAMEIAWADLARIPVVVAMEAKGNPHDHGMINEAIGFRVTTIDEAIDVVKAIADNAPVR